MDYENYFPRTDEDYLQFRWDVGAIATRQLVHDEIIASSGRLLEIGPGAYAVFASEFGPEWEVHVVDISKNTLETARQYASRPIAYHHGKLDALAFPDEHFDVVVSSHVIEHIDNDAAFLQECYRISKPGGLIVVATPGQVSGDAEVWEWERWGHYRNYNSERVLELVDMLPGAQLESLKFRHQFLGPFWNRAKYALHAINYPFRWYLLRDNRSVFGRRVYQRIAPALARWLNSIDAHWSKHEGALSQTSLVVFRIHKPGPLTTH